ncbi:MAG: glycosyltransferase [Burkholderiales bacterium]|nr:glycosyltransferase [Opitutaceae bacterium]
MKLSIIIPSYNQGRFIGRTLDSIIAQDDPDCEIILMDGGSTDSTLAVVERYRDKLSVMVSQRDGGQSDALMRGYGLATGDYIGWQNSDDVYLPGSFAQFRARLAADQATGAVADVYYGNQVVMGPDDQVLYGKIFGPFQLPYLLYAGWNITNQSSFFSRKKIQEIGGFDASLHYAMDFDFYVRLARGRARFVWHDAYWGGFRIHDLSKGSTLHATRDREYIMLRQRYVPGYDAGRPWARQFRLRRAWLKTKRILWLLGSGRIARMLRDRSRPSPALLKGGVGA